jgi:predicted nucleic acid-binding protein
MEWVKNLNGKKIGLDTAPLIYFMEENSLYLETVREFFEAMDRGDFTVVTSTITLLEVLIHPFRNNNITLASEYRDILLRSNLIMMDITSSISENAAQLRAIYNLRTPDAIQIATAQYAEASYFLTNDIRLPRIEGIEILMLDNLSLK